MANILGLVLLHNPLRAFLFESTRLVFSRHTEAVHSDLIPFAVNLHILKKKGHTVWQVSNLAVHQARVLHVAGAANIQRGGVYL